MKKILVTLSVLTAAVVWNHSLKIGENDQVKGAVLKTKSEQNLEKDSLNAGSKSEKDNKTKQADKDKKNKLKKDSKKLKRKFASKKRRKKNRKKKRQIIDDSPFEANFDHLPDYTVYKGDSDFQEELRDPGSL